MKTKPKKSSASSRVPSPVRRDQTVQKGSETMKRQLPAQTRPPRRHIAIPGKFQLRLYVAGATARSQRAIQRARHYCETELKDNYELEIIDIYQHPVLARAGQILATPTLVRTSPAPVRRLIGNLSDAHGFFIGLELNTPAQSPP